MEIFVSIVDRDLNYTHLILKRKLVDGLEYFTFLNPNCATISDEYTRCIYKLDLGEIL